MGGSSVDGSAGFVQLHACVTPSPFSLGPKQSVKIVVKVVGCTFALSLVIIFARGIWGSLHHLPWASHADLGPADDNVVKTLACFLVIWDELRRHRIPWRSLGAWRVEPITLFAPFFLLVLGVVTLISDAGNWLKAALPPPAWITQVFSQLHDLASHPISGPLSLVVIAPLTEELIFRGLILRGLLARTSPWRAIVISALLFALIHVNPWQFPTAFVAGLVLGWAYFRTGSLTLCMAGHALHNSIALLATGLPFVIRGFNSTPPAGTVDFQPWWFNLTGVALVLVGTAWFLRWVPPLVKTAETPALPVPVTANPVESR
jgi:membrane protease YdiL (CAAX protease family)